MRKNVLPNSWVVYETPAEGKRVAMQVVCEQGEWAKLKEANPALRLVKTGIPNEGEAERFARSETSSLATGPRQYR